MVILKEVCLLGYNTMLSIESQLMFQKNIGAPSSGLRSKQSKKPLKLEIACSSKWTACYYNPEDENLHNPCCENLRSYMIILDDKIYRFEQQEVSEISSKSDSQSVALKIRNRLKLFYFQQNRV
jgi:hypothetical protein